jgi:hypothetical protein
MENCSTSVIREMQIKTTLRFYPNLARIATMKKKENIISTKTLVRMCWERNPYTPVVGI